MKTFSITSLFILVTLVAVAYSTWNQHRQQLEIAELKDRLIVVENDARLRARINDLFEYFDPENDDKMETFELLRNLIPKSPNLSLPQEHQQLTNLFRSATLIADVDGNPGGLEMLSLSNTFITIPGSSYSVNALFDDDRIVDILVRRTGTRIETHSVEMLDTDGDEQLELVLYCQPGFKSTDSAKQLNYFATKTGFSLSQ